MQNASNSRFGSVGQRLVVVYTVGRLVARCRDAEIDRDVLILEALRGLYWVRPEHLVPIVARDIGEFGPDNASAVIEEALARLRAEEHGAQQHRWKGWR